MKLFVVLIAIVTVAQPADLDAVLEKLDSWIDSSSGASWRAEVQLRMAGDPRNSTWLRVD